MGGPGYSPPILSVIVPTVTGREHWLKQALWSIERTVSRIHEEIVILDKPTCGEGWNIGIEQAQGDYILLFADDLEAHQGWFEAGVESLERGIIPCARILNPDGTLQSCGDYAKEAPGRDALRPRPRSFPHPRDGEGAAPDLPQPLHGRPLDHLEGSATRLAHPRQPEHGVYSSLRDGRAHRHSGLRREGVQEGDEVKYIVTGGSGFLGSHICHELEQHGHEVVVFDLQLSRFHDLRFPECVEVLFSAHADADVCIHLAAKVGRLFGEDNPMETITDNVGMTALVAQQAGRLGIRMVYASTSEVYGDNGTAVCDEYDGPFSLPHNVYGISKFFGEGICEHYAPDDLTIFRFSMPYGPGLPAGRGRAAIINMLHQALHGKQMNVHIGAERSWCYVRTR